MRIWLAGAAIALIPLATSADPEAARPAGHICAVAPPGAGEAPAQALLAGYGTGGFAIRTASPRAQAYFDNGMQLAHAFAHQPATAAFQEAERLDPGCAMCVWGEAWSRGPTLNYTIDARGQAQAQALADKAAALAKDGPPLERQLTAALQARYHDGGGMGAGDYAFARAMDEIAKARPTDNEVAILTADAWMIPASHKDNRDNLPHAIALLQGALARRPNDTGAIHFYIHATENDGVAAEALPYAEKLQALAPAASHLVHMPSHTYYRVGMYEAAVRANLDATRIDEANAARLQLRDGVWGLNYHAHNVQFGTDAALMDGDAAAALKLADGVVARLAKPPISAQDLRIAATAYFAEGRYADPAKVLALPPPAPGAPVLAAAWHYARGEAFARQGHPAGALFEAMMIQQLAAKAPLSGAPQAMLGIPRQVLLGRTEMLQGHPDKAVQPFREAAELQERLLAGQADPPPWWYPVRRSLAAALLASGKPTEALAETQKVLAGWPGDPMTLVIAARAQTALGHRDAARRDTAEARKGWRGDPTAASTALL
ncbi:MAG TPA: hypothetical protein VHV27_09050 [Phenylobacterium sp.]|jgi:tetratricopeptide (TPR) repeat protein|nr:hypothetical protein [Phenylobacterium sp.]